jgi:N-acetylglucosaminyldiphosphoundecaprenol N-acetyl-beta-D-mannosaminyltransferase
MTMLSMTPSSVMPESLASIHILDLPVHQVTMETALNTIDAFIRDGSPHHVITADASMMVMAQQDAPLRSIVANAELITPDSEGILWASRRQGCGLPERVSGVEIVERLCERSASSGQRLYFLGAAPGVAEKAKARMEAKYPGAQVVGTRNGFFTDADLPAVLDGIRACRPDVLCVAMGIPKQEKWIAAHRDALGVPVLIGVGGTLDVLSDSVKRAPLVMRKLKLEWLWRVISNPRKISKVMLLPRFVALVCQHERKK